MAKVKQLIEQLPKLDQEANIFGMFGDELVLIYDPEEVNDEGVPQHYQLHTLNDLAENEDNWYELVGYFGEQWEEYKNGYV